MNSEKNIFMKYFKHNNNIRSLLSADYTKIYSIAEGLKIKKIFEKTTL